MKLNSKVDSIHGLLSSCAAAAVITVIVEWASRHYIRAVLAGVLFVVVIPWLGKRLANRFCITTLLAHSRRPSADSYFLYTVGVGPFSSDSRSQIMPSRL